MRCPDCHVESPEGSNFCGICGVSLLPAHGEHLDAERRQLTVLFCDLVGSTALSRQLDPEDYREVIQEYHRFCTAEINRFDGTVSQYLGDGLLALFGYPIAHEDDAERAARAGLGVAGAMPALNESLASKVPSPLSVRIGMATGLVVVGAAEDQAVVGDSTNLAARLQELAHPNSVVIASETKDLLGALFEFHDLGCHRLKGFSEDVRAWEVLTARETHSRFDAVHAELTSLVGRGEQLDLLLHRWRQAKEGKGQVVLLAGEPGIGKSRIARELGERILVQVHSRLHFQCSPYYTNSALYPLIASLAREAKFSRGDSPEEKLDKLKTLLSESTDQPDESVALFAALMSIPSDVRYPLAEMTAEKRRAITFTAVSKYIEAISHRTPLLMILEDAHWIDPTSLELLGNVIDQMQGLRVLLVITFRFEFTHSWSHYSHVTSLTLGRLTNTECMTLIANLTADRPLPDLVAGRLLERVDGVPLYVEELTRSVLEAGSLEKVENGAWTSLKIPTSLQDSLMGRLDRLGLVKEVAQMAATIGREFTYDILARVSKMGDEKLEAALDQLARASVVLPHGSPPHRKYRFKHALVRDVAYESLLKTKKRKLHGDVAKELEIWFWESREVDPAPEVVAHHLTQAHLLEKAVSFWNKAGTRAVNRSAYREAESHFQKGITLLQKLPPTPDHKKQELTLHLALGSAMVATEGYSAEKLHDIWAHSLNVCRQLGNPPDLYYQVCWEYSAFEEVQGRLEEARNLAEKCLDIAAGTGDSGQYVNAHRILGEIFFYMGELGRSRDHLELCVAQYDKKQHEEYVALSGDDPGAIALMYLSIVLWLLGFPDQAETRCQQGLVLAHELPDTYTLAQAEFYASWLYALQRESPKAKSHAQTAMALCEKHGFNLYLGLSTMIYGWAASACGQVTEGVDEMTVGMELIRETDAGLCLSCFLTWLTEGLMMAGRTEEAEKNLLESFDVALEGFNDAERLRLKAELASMRGSTQKEVQEYCRRAVDIARQQSSASLELRAALSLSRLSLEQDKENSVRTLERVYARFKEGFNTVDLVDARAVIELASRGDIKS